MPILELCAGYGGLGMAVEALTGDTVTYVAEVDEAACRVLALRFPGAPNIGDITTYNWSQLVGRVDIVTAGFPCQDISPAGLRKGINGERTGIYRHVVEAVRVLRPRLVFLENVAAIKTRGLWQVAADLAAIGYDLRWTCLRASDAGGAHHRDRWFGIASPAVTHGGGRPRHCELPGGRNAVRERVRADADGCDPGVPSGPDGTRLEVGGLEPARAELAPAVGSGARPEDPDRPARAERSGAAPREASRGGHGPTLDDEVSFLLPHASGVGRAARRPEPEGEQRGLRAPRRGGESAPDSDGIGRDGGGRGRAPRGRAGRTCGRRLLTCRMVG